MTQRRVVFGVLAAVLLAAQGAAGEPVPPSKVAPLTSATGFPFVMPWNAGPTGTAMDMSFLNSAPAGAHGRIVAKDGRFYESGTGKGIRFFGVNLPAAAAFPRLEDADGIARRLRMLGVNLVRMHHLNNGWDLDGGTIWKQGRTYIEIDPKQLQKLDCFIAALKRQGIYTNINLQTARKYVPELGLPDTAASLPDYGKKVDKFFPRMIEIQKEYARQLLDRTNPYTRLKYKDDPALLAIEINNENSLVGWPGESPGAALPSLPSPFKETITRMWNQWLLKKHGSDAGLRRAWPKTSTTLGRSLTSKASQWAPETHGAAEASFVIEEGSGSDAEAPTITSTVKSVDGTDWHIQINLPGLDLASDKAYTVKFRAKADRPLTAVLNARLDKEDWRFIGITSSLSFGTEWKDYVVSFTASATEPRHSRIGLVLGGMTGTLTVAGLTVYPGAYVAGLGEGESAEAGTVPLPAPESSPRFRDYTAFLAETEAAYAETMRSWLAGTLGFGRTFIIDSQASWGGLTSFLREKNSPYRDDHAYWNHPVFLGGNWDPKNYRVTRSALVDAIGAGNGTFGSLALQRVAGRPYSISEYDHPAPSDFQVEMMPLYSIFAAFQDWDCIYVFDWEATGTGRQNSMYAGYFDAALNPAKYAFFPLAALLFRQGLAAPASQTALLTLPATPWQPRLNAWDAWASHHPNPMVQKLAMQQGKGSSSSFQVLGQAGAPAFKKAAGPSGSYVTAGSPSYRAVVGFVGGTSAASTGFEASFGSFGAQFASLALASVDGSPLQKAGKVLLTVGARFENQDMGWNQERNSVGDQWGSGPVLAEVVPVTISLAVDGLRQVYALRADGSRGAKIPSVIRNGRLSFTLGQHSRAVWVEIVKP